jgi:hypothetical protein
MGAVTADAAVDPPSDVPPETLEFRAIDAHEDHWVPRSAPVSCS